jgi:hypothetical protein
MKIPGGEKLFACAADFPNSGSHPVGKNVDRRMHSWFAGVILFRGGHVRASVVATWR